MFRRLFFVARRLFNGPIDPEANRWAEAVKADGGTVSPERLEAVSRKVVAWRKNGVWDIFDTHFVFSGAENLSQASTPLRKH